MPTDNTGVLRAQEPARHTSQHEKQTHRQLRSTEAPRRRQASKRCPHTLRRARQPDAKRFCNCPTHKHTLLRESHAATLSMEAMQLQGRPTPPPARQTRRLHTPSTVQVVLLSGQLQHTQESQGSPCHRTHPHPNYAHRKAKGCAWVHTQATTRGGTGTTNQTGLCTPQRASAATWRCTTFRKPRAAKT